MVPRGGVGLAARSNAGLDEVDGESGADHLSMAGVMMRGGVRDDAVIASVLRIELRAGLPQIESAAINGFGGDGGGHGSSKKARILTRHSVH